MTLSCIQDLKFQNEHQMLQCKTYQLFESFKRKLIRNCLSRLKATFDLLSCNRSSIYHEIYSTHVYTMLNACQHKNSTLNKSRKIPNGLLNYKIKRQHHGINKDQKDKTVTYTLHNIENYRLSHTNPTRDDLSFSEWLSTSSVMLMSIRTR